MTTAKTALYSLTLATGLTLGAHSLAVNYDYDPAHAYSSSDTIRVVIRSTPGGGYDTWGRLVARHLGKHLPGSPRLVAENRPGAGGLVAMNYMFNNAPSDGTAILMATRELAVAERTGEPGVNYRTLDYGMLGSATSESRIWLTANNHPVSHLNDIHKLGRTFIWSAAGIGDGSYQMTDLMAQVGYPTRVVTGFEGTGEQLLSILRGDVDGFAAAYPSQRGIINDEKLQIIAKLGQHPDLEGKVDDIRQIFTDPDHITLANVLAAPLVASRPFLTHPDVPAGRLDILQKGFRSLMDDPEFIAEANANGYEVIFTSPEDMVFLYEQTLNAPDKVMAIISK